MAELAELRAPLGPPPSRPLDRGALKAWLGAADDWSKVDGSEARVLASLLSSFPLSVLGQGVLDDSELLADYLPSSFVLEEETGPLHCGSVLLVHGSAPFDMDGRIPIEDPELRYGREPFYADLGARLRAAGWAVLRYAKPGVSSDGLDMTRYMTTDVSLLGLQLQNLWRFLPEDRPRVVVAWSEGTLHVSQLPLDEVKGIVFLGGISTDLADIVAAQGGPSKDALMAELTGLPRDAPLGLDRPVGRVLDEVSMEPNWVTLSRDFPGQLLVLHGGADEEVPVSQARGWVGRFPEGRLTVVIGDGLDHRYMDPGVYQPERPGDVIADWLGREFGAGCVGPPG